MAMAYIEGIVLFSDGIEVILKTQTGIGHQIYFHSIVPEGQLRRFFISHVYKESGQDLYAHLSIRDKKLFEMLITVKGVGPKLAYQLLSFLSAEQVIQAITLENKKLLTSTPGVGPKVAAQLILDLQQKIYKVRMYSDAAPTGTRLQEQVDLTEKTFMQNLDEPEEDQKNRIDFAPTNQLSSDKIFLEALAACKALGLKEEEVRIKALPLLQEHGLNRPEQLVHLILKQF